MDNDRRFSPWTTPCLPEHYLGPQPHPLSLMAGRPWPKRYEDLFSLLEGPLDLQHKSFKKRFRDVENHRDTDQDYTYGSLAILAEFWRMHKAMEERGAQRAVMSITSLPMHSYDYKVAWQLEGLPPDAERKRWWKRANPDHTVVIPCVFPEDILGYGAIRLLDRKELRTLKSHEGTYSMTIDRNTPLDQQIEYWFGKDYCQDWKLQKAHNQGASHTA